MTFNALKTVSSFMLMTNKKNHFLLLIAVIVSLFLPLQSRHVYAYSNHNLTSKEYRQYKERLVKTGLYENKDGSVGGALNLSDGTTGRVLKFTKKGELIVVKPAVNKDGDKRSVYIKIKYSLSDVKQYLSRREANYGK